MEDAAPDPEAPSIDAVLRALGDPERRFVLVTLRDLGPLSEGALGDVLCGWLATKRSGGVVDAAERRHVEARLHHAHLPVLEAAGLVTAGREGLEAQRLPEPVDATVQAALEAARTEDDRPRRHRVDDAR